MSEQLPPGLVALTDAVEALGFVRRDDFSPRPAFRVIVFEHGERRLGRVVELVQEFGIWGVEISIEGDHSQGPDAILEALDSAHVPVHAGFEGMRDTTVEALNRMPQTEPQAELLREGLRKQRRSLTRWASGRDSDLAHARELFREERFEESLAVFSRLEDDELDRADRMRVELARQRTTAR